jgi:hypothetical protein
MRTTTAPAALALLALAVTGCTSHPSGSAALAGPSGGDKSLLTPYGEKLPSGGGAAMGGADSAGGAAGERTGAKALAPAGTAMTAAEPAPGLPGQPGIPPSQSDAALRAGFVDDNARFDDYLAYRERTSKRIGADELDISERHVVTVLDRDGKPVLGARVTLADGNRELQTVRTHSDGRALLFPLVTDDPQATSYDVHVAYAGAKADARITDRSDRDHTIRLDITRPDEPTRLDLHFLVDTTGSMGDEIDRLRTSLDDIARQIDALPQRPIVRYGLTIYRDHGDAYLSRTNDFTDLKTFREELSKVSADGGGDTPEALDEAFHGAVNGPAWDSDRAVQITFLVADASPHLGPGNGPSYAKDVQVAAEKGIEVVPLAASGTDDPAEYVFRQLAQYSLGTFFFLTYGPDGHSPGDGTDRDVHGYQTGSLDDLVVKHVADRLAAKDGKAPSQ